MATWLCRVSGQPGQFRLTVPKGLVAEMDWYDVKCVLMKKAPDGVIKIRRFIDGESLKDEGSGDIAGQD